MNAPLTYRQFLESKIKLAEPAGFSVSADEINPSLKDFVAASIPWLAHGGRRALFSSFGLHKTSAQTELARLARKRGCIPLIILPLGVRYEFFDQASNHFKGEYAVDLRFIRTSAEVDRENREPDGPIYLSNYEGDYPAVDKEGNILFVKPLSPKAENQGVLGKPLPATAEDLARHEPPTAAPETVAAVGKATSGNGTGDGGSRQCGAISGRSSGYPRGARLAVYGLSLFLAAGEPSFGGSLDPTYMTAAGPEISSPEAAIIPPEFSGYPPINSMSAFWKAARAIAQASNSGGEYRGIIIPGGMASVVDINNTCHPLRLKTSAISCEKVIASGSPATWKMRSPNFGRSARLSTSDIFSACCADILRHANSNRSVSVLNSAAAARALASATFSSDSLLASPVATMARTMTTYSTMRPIAMKAFATIPPIFSFRSWGNQNSSAISTIIPIKINKVARADQRSRDSSFWWAELFLWPKAEGPYADMIRRSKRRLIIFLIFAAILLSLAILFHG